MPLWKPTAKSDLPQILGCMVGGILFIIVLEMVYPGPAGSFTGPKANVKTGYLLFCLLFNLLFAGILFRLRLSSRDLPMTLSQRWGLTILGWLFFANSIEIFIEMLSTLGAGSVPDSILQFNARMLSQLNLLSFLPLLIFGLVYPRPVLRWNRLIYLLWSLAGLWFVLLILHGTYLSWHPFTFLDNDYPLVPLMLVCSSYIPIFLWLPELEKRSSPQMAVVLTMLIWGYMFYMVSTEMRYLVGIQKYQIWSNNLSIVITVLSVMVFILIGRSMYHTRGRWGTIEKTHLVLFALAVLFLVVNGSWDVIENRLGVSIYEDTLFILMSTVLAEGGWMFLRPTLFSYGLLRYQVFGTKVPASRWFTMAITILGCWLLLLIAFFGLKEIGPWLGVLVGLLVAGVVFYPLYKITKRFVQFLFPMGAGSTKATLAERRATYLMGLQTAVVEGEISDDYDKGAMEQLRTDLKVSEREHDLLMEGFVKERSEAEVEGMEEIYLFHKGGTMLGYVARKEGKGASGKSDQMATMFATVGNFLKDTLRKGGGQVDSIEYGKMTLVAEVEGDIALGVILRGKDNPQVRQRMRDILGRIKKEYSESISILMGGSVEKFGVAKERLKGLEGLLRESLME